MLFDVLKKDRMQAMKDKFALKKDLLSCLIGDCSKNTKEPSDSEVIAMIKKFINNANILLEECKKADSLNDAANQANAEIEILNSYLPSQLSETAIFTAINMARNLGNNDVGSINKFLKAQYEGRYDGKVANGLIKQVLSDN